MTGDSDTPALCFPFCSSKCVRGKPRACSGEGEVAIGACSVYFFAIYFKRLMTQPRTFLAQWDPSRAQGPCFVYFSAAGKGRGATGGLVVKQE